MLFFLNFIPFLFLHHFSLSFVVIVVLRSFLRAILIAISCVLLSLGLHFLRNDFFLIWFAFRRVGNFYGFFIFPYFFSFSVLLVSIGSCPSFVAF